MGKYKRGSEVPQRVISDTGADAIRKTRSSQWFAPVRSAVLRGLAVILPPLITVLVVIWVFQLVSIYIFEPMRATTREVIIWLIKDIRSEEDIWAQGRQPPNPADRLNPIRDGVVYQRLPDGDYLPKSVYDRLLALGVPRKELVTAEAVYRIYVDRVYLQPWKTALTFTCLLLLVLYFLGKLMAAEVGRLVWTQFEGAMIRLPLIRTIYSAAKQVSDFLLSRPRITASRVVAVEWPRKGSWALGFVTSEGMRDVQDAAGEPILTVLVATSPMPMTGFTVQVRKSETIDLGISLEEAVQFILSCGVVVPSTQAIPRPVSATGELTSSPITDAAQPVP